MESKPQGPLWKISIDDEFVEYQYPIDISENESIESVYMHIRKLFGDIDRRNQAIRRSNPTLYMLKDGEFVQAK